MNRRYGQVAAFLAVLLTFGGYAFVFRPYETAIADRYDRIDRAQSLIDAQRDEARRIDALMRERDRLTAFVEASGMRRSRPAAVSSFLHELVTIAALPSLHITAVTADRNTATTALITGNDDPARTKPLVTFDELPLALSTRGTYVDVVTLLHRLDRLPIAARVALASIESADRTTGSNPTLRATIHVTLLLLPHDAVHAGHTS